MTSVTHSPLIFCTADNDDSIQLLTTSASMPYLRMQHTTPDERRSMSVHLSEEDRLLLAHHLAPEHVPAPSYTPEVGDKVQEVPGGTTYEVMYVGDHRLFLRDVSEGYEISYLKHPRWAKVD